MGRFDIPVSNIVLVRALLVGVALLSLITALISDYSHLYPKTLRMNVFFDRRGIERILKGFSPAERKEIGLLEEYEEHRQAYYASLDRELERVLRERVIFADHHADVHSEGETTFITEKVSGAQRYCIEESEGRLQHVLERPRQTPLRFMTFFEKRSSASDYFEPSLWRLVQGRGCIITPRFNQLLAEDMKSSGRVFDHAIVGITRLRLYPYPSYSTTLYATEVPDGGLAPIGYAVYK